MQSAATFRELLSQHPFRPFQLAMADGKSFDVCHPRLAFVTRADLLVGVEPDDDNIPCEFRICPLVNVVSVNYLPQ